MMRHKQASDAIASWHRDLGFPKHEFATLSKKERKVVAKELEDAMVWWQRNGKDVDVAEDLKDEENFRKAQLLAQFWRKQNMSNEDREAAVDEISDMFDWARKQSKDLNLDDVDDAKADKMMKLLQAWASKRDKTKSKVKEIEEAMGWWKRNSFSVDSEGASTPDAEKMNKLNQLVQKWSDLTSPEDGAAADDNLDWFRKKNLDDISDSFKSFEESKEEKAPAVSEYTGKMSDEQKRAQEMASALDWLRTNDAELDILVSCSVFKADTQFP